MGKKVQKCVLCWEVVSFSESPLSEVPLYSQCVLYLDIPFLLIPAIFFVTDSSSPLPKEDAPPEPRPQNGVQQSSPESGQTAAPPTLEIEVAEEGVGQGEEDVGEEEGVVLSPLSTACELHVWMYFML